MSNKGVYIIIVTYNGEIDIESCIDSILNSNYPAYIVVVDNKSTDNTVLLIKEKYPSVYLIELNENLGFGRANNLGISYAYDHGAEFVFLLNQDTWILRDTILILVNFHKNNKEILISTPVQMNGEGTAIDSRFSDHVSGAVFVNCLLSDVVISNLISEHYEVKFANAAAWFMRRECIEIVGVFNPIFQHYGEDVEYVNRLNEKGYKLYLITTAKIFHNRTQSIFNGNQSVESLYVGERAIVNIRLSNNKRKEFINLMSALFRILSIRHDDFLGSIILKGKLLFYLVSNYFKIIRFKKRAFGESLPFLRDK